MPFGHVDDFKLKTIKAPHTQEKLFTFSVTTYKDLSRGPIPGRELILKITFLSERCTCTHDKHLFTKHPFASLCDLSSSSFPLSLAQDGIQASNVLSLGVVSPGLPYIQNFFSCLSILCQFNHQTSQRT